MDVIGIGPAGIDIIYTAEGVKKSAGGSIINTLVRLQALGARTGVLGLIGNDPEGKSMIARLTLLGIDTSKIRHESAYRTPRCHMRTGKGLKEFIDMDEYKRIGRLNAKDMEYLKKAKAIFLEIVNPIFKEYLEFAKRHGKKVYVTLQNIDSDYNLHYLKDPYISAIFCNTKESKHIKGMMPEIRSTLAVTKRERGSNVYQRGRDTDTPAFRVDTIDQLGTGDAFAAGFIYGDLKGWGMKRKCLFANAMGAFATVGWGAQGKVPFLEEVEELIRQQADNLA